ncbi:MAG TPA: SMP-30/gluconolactonase/LRE family protein [Kofleriaceae bacterium]|nr:SMP-30/gluconolactonase/LRE family protein [Kofleriaceae bacterium]
MGRGRVIARRVGLGLAVLFVLLVAYLFLWPVPLDPEAWNPPPAVALDGVWARNDRLARGELLGETLHGPEAVAFDARGRAITGTMGGDLVAIDASGAVSPIARTGDGGRPLGIKIAADGSILVADATLGLMRVVPGGATKLLADAQGGRRFRFTDDLDLLPDGSVVFTDASSERGVHEFRMEVLDHRPNGRLLRHDPATGATTLVAARLYFPNGVAAAPDGESVIVCETSSYRLLRVFVTGARAGQREVFLDRLPGFCDNVTWSGASHRYWVAIGSPRDATLDALSPRPFLRKMVARLPAFAQPDPKPFGMAIAVSDTGQVLDVLMDPDGRFGPFASVIEHDGALYLGTYSGHGVLRVPLEPSAN